jgi:hypothetical protein
VQYPRHRMPAVKDVRNTACVAHCAVHVVTPMMPALLQLVPVEMLCLHAVME